MKLHGNRSHFTTVPPFEGANVDDASCLSEDTDSLQATVRQQRNFIAPFPCPSALHARLTMFHHLFFNRACEDSKSAQNYDTPACMEMSL